MNTSWRAANGAVECEWNDPEVQPQCDLSWLNEIEDEIVTNPAGEVPNFAAHGPLGSGEWFAPWNARWSLPGRMKA